MKIAKKVLTVFIAMSMGQSIASQQNITNISDPLDTISTKSLSQSQYTPSGYFTIYHDLNSHNFYSPLSKLDPIQLITHEEDDESFCSATACLGERKTFGMKGLPIPFGWKIKLAASLLNSDQVVCPFGSMRAEVTDVTCALDGTSVLDQLVIGGNSAGPLLEDLVISGDPCDGSNNERPNFYIFDISCYSSTLDYPKHKLLRNTKDLSSNRPKSLNEFMIGVDTSNSGFWVDGIKYHTELGMRDDNEEAGCTTSYCFGGYFYAYIYGPNKQTFVFSIADDDLGSAWEMACPYGHQTPSIAGSECINESGNLVGTDIVSAGSVSGPILFDLDKTGTCSGDGYYVTITISCLG